MFGFGFGEFLVLAAVVVLFFYARRLPDLARSIGRTAKSFREGLGKDEKDDARPVRDVRPLNPPKDE